MILFMAFLNESRPETWRELGRTANYEEFVKQRPVFRTIECVHSHFMRLDDQANVFGSWWGRKELRHTDIDVLLPIKQQIASGVALDDEVAEFVAQRHGRILSAFTLLKSDFFR